jgi:hypothetical protein
MDGTHGVSRPNKRDKTDLRYRPSCDSPCGRGHTTGCGRRRDDVLLDVRYLVAWLLHSLLRAQQELQLETMRCIEGDSCDARILPPGSRTPPLEFLPCSQYALAGAEKMFDTAHVSKSSSSLGYPATPRMRRSVLFEQLRRAHPRSYGANSQARLLLLEGITTTIHAVQNVTDIGISSGRQSRWFFEPALGECDDELSEVYRCANPSVQATRNHRNYAPGYGLLPAVSLREMRCKVLSFFIYGED